MASQLGTKGRPGRDMADDDVLAGLAGALGNSAASQGAGIAEDAAGGRAGFGLGLRSTFLQSRISSQQIYDPD